MKTCSAPGCTIQIPAAVLMCRSHWFMVPRALRFEVNRAWSAWLQAQPADSARFWNSYHDARQQAIQAVTREVAS